MGIPTLLETNTITSSTAISAFTSSIDSTYDEYMFVFTDVNPSTDWGDWQFAGSTDGGSNYGVTKTTVAWGSGSAESGASSWLTYHTSNDRAQSTDSAWLSYDTGTASNYSTNGILHLFTPSNTTYVKHFICRSANGYGNNYSNDWFVAGYFNTTSAINAVKFHFDTGNIDTSVIQMYGIK